MLLVNFEGLDDAEAASGGADSVGHFRAPEGIPGVEFTPHQWALLIAGICTLVATNICFNVIADHCRAWKRPREQRAIIAILLMAPVFAVASYIGLADLPGREAVSTILDSVKECYEAYVISEFLTLLFSFVGVPPDFDSQPLLLPHQAALHKPLPQHLISRTFHHSFPFTLVLPHSQPVSPSSLRMLLLFTRQFVIVRPLLSLLLCALQLLGLAPPPLPFLFSLLFNASVYVAVYALLLFFHTFELQLLPHRPLAKFLCVKGIVFAAFWQSLLVSILVSYRFLHKGHLPFTVKQVDEAVCNFLVCVEVLPFSFAFRNAFSAKEYEDLVGGGQNGNENDVSMEPTLKGKKEQ